VNANREEFQNTRGQHFSMTVGQAARILGVTPQTVSRWADEGRLPHDRTEGGHRRFRVADIAALLAPPTREGDDAN
jgi:excisionase family DNA binding protein